MITGTTDELKDIAINNVCAEHGSPLFVKWFGPENAWVLACGHGECPDKVKRILSLTEEHKAGEALPSPIVDSIKRGQKHRAMAAGADKDHGELLLIPHYDLGDNHALSPQEFRLIIDYCIHYGLDPGRGHVVLMYSKPYVTLDGYLYHAHQQNIAYKLDTHPMTDEERHNYQLEEGDHGWLSALTVGDGKLMFIGLGIVTREEMTEESKGKPGQLRSPVVAKHPWQLAQKRAEWQALRRAFPIGETKQGEE